MVSLGLSTIALVRGDGNLLLDTGHYGNRNQLLNALNRLGMKPADIDTVILTHSHWDHALNLEVFGGADVVINSKELSHVNSIKGYDWATPSFLGRVLGERRVKVVEGDVAFSKDVFLVETPGHSPGHQSVLVKTDGGSVLFSGDAMPTMRSYIREQPDYIMVSDEVARSSIRKMKSLKPDVIYPGHDRPFHVVDGCPEYISHSELKLVFRGVEGNFGISMSTEDAEKPEKK